MSLIDTIKTEPTVLPPRLVVFGQGGVGKTTFASKIPGVVFLPAEEGEGNLRLARFPTPESYEDVINTIASLLKEEHGYKALCIDTVDHVEPLVWDAVCQQKSTDKKTYEHIEDFGYGKGYTFADPYWTRILRGLDTLRREKKMTTVLLAHAESRIIEDPVVGAYDRWVTKLHKRGNALIHEWADLVGFAQIERSPRTKEGARGREVKTSTTTGKRILSLEDTGGFIAKNRFSLPPRIDLDYETLRAEIIKSFSPAEPAENEAA
jgi:hypothetical protein